MSSSPKPTATDTDNASGAAPRPADSEQNARRRARALDWIVLAAVILVGGFLRFYRLGQLPPGDGYDVAQYGVDALEILRGARPIFLTSNFGREPLFSYLVALAYVIVGPGTLGIRLVSSTLGLLTIPATYLAGMELFRGSSLVLRRYLPALAALLAAVSYWHINWSRLGLRVVLVPLLAALIVFALWRAFRSDRRRWYFVAGALLGLSLYTYQAARILPLLVVVAFVLQGLLRWTWSRRETANVLLTLGVATLVFLPLGAYAWQNPGALSARIEQAVVVDTTLPLKEQIGALSTQAITALLSYSVRGDKDPQFNIPGRPTLDPFLSIGLLLGIWICLWRWRRQPYLFLLAWLLLMTAPAMVADLAAMAKRYLGAFPAVMILVALGLLLPVEWLVRRETTGKPSRRAAIAYGVILTAGLLYSSVATYRDYFVVWAADPDLPTHFQVEYREIGRAIGGLPADETVWLSPYPPDQPVIQLHAGLRPDLRGYNGRFCSPLAAMHDGGTTYVIVPGLQDRSLAQLQALYPQGKTEMGTPRPGSDRPYFDIFRVPASSPAPILPATGGAVWDDQIELAGANLESTSAAPGEAVEVTLTYRALAPVAANLTAFVHLLGEPHAETGSPLWAQNDSEPCGGARPTSSWRTSDVLRDTVTLQLPPDIPAGEYQVVTGFYTWPDLTRLVEAGGSDAITIGTLQVLQP